jgi:hypothetical protein
LLDRGGRNERERGLGCRVARGVDGGVGAAQTVDVRASGRSCDGRVGVDVVVERAELGGLVPTLVRAAGLRTNPFCALCVF